MFLSDNLEHNVLAQAKKEVFVPSILFKIIGPLKGVMNKIVFWHFGKKFDPKLHEISEF